MKVRITEHIASGARFVAPRLIERLDAYRDDTAGEQPVLDAVGLRVPIAVEVGERVGSPAEGALIRLCAKEHAERFPVFEGTLRVLPITTLDSTLVLDGCYEVPLGLIGRLADRTVMHAAAEHSLARLMARMKAEVSADILNYVIGKAG
jgi:hypothetical protein